MYCHNSKDEGVYVEVGLVQEKYIPLPHQQHLQTRPQTEPCSQLTPSSVPHPVRRLRRIPSSEAVDLVLAYNDLRRHPHGLEIYHARLLCCPLPRDIVSVLP